MTPDLKPVSQKVLALKNSPSISRKFQDLKVNDVNEKFN